MVFSNLFFLYFFLPLNLICYFLAKSIHVRNGILIVFSLFFYAWGEPRYVPLLVGMVLINWIFGLMIEKYRGQKLAKAGLIGACICSLTLLGIFKYLTLILERPTTCSVCPALCLRSCCRSVFPFIPFSCFPTWWMFIGAR